MSVAMSEGPDLTETEAFAAEYALGVLTAAERREAEARIAADPAFAREVEAWRERLAPMIEGVAAAPAPEGLWARIERALPANDDTAAAGALRFWRAATAGASALAAASLAAAVFLANQPPARVRPPEPGQLLNASLVSPSGGASVPLFVAAYDPVRKALIVTSLVQPGTDPVHVHELWVIPADGKARPLGFIEPGKTKAMPMPAALLPSLAAGSAIAVSVEPPGGSPKADAPSGPIAAIGKLAKI
jgi:anti-sigma-K factor RskA